MRAQLAPITLVSIVVVQAGRRQIVTGLALPTHRGQARHRQRDHNVDLVLLLQLVEPPAADALDDDRTGSLPAACGVRVQHNGCGSG